MNEVWYKKRAVKHDQTETKYETVYKLLFIMFKY